jgi:hypothetical protein
MNTKIISAIVLAATILGVIGSTSNEIFAVHNGHGGFHGDHGGHFGHHGFFDGNNNICFSSAPFWYKQQAGCFGFGFNSFDGFF